MGIFKPKTRDKLLHSFNLHGELFLATKNKEKDEELVDITLLAVKAIDVETRGCKGARRLYRDAPEMPGNAKVKMREMMLDENKSTVVGKIPEELKQNKKEDRMEKNPKKKVQKSTENEEFKPHHNNDRGTLTRALKATAWRSNIKNTSPNKESKKKKEKGNPQIKRQREDRTPQANQTNLATEPEKKNKTDKVPIGHNHPEQHPTKGYTTESQTPTPHLNEAAHIRGFQNDTTKSIKAKVPLLTPSDTPRTKYDRNKDYCESSLIKNLPFTSKGGQIITKKEEVENAGIYRFVLLDNKTKGTTRLPFDHNEEEGKWMAHHPASMTTKTTDTTREIMEKQVKKVCDHWKDVLKTQKPDSVAAQYFKEPNLCPLVSNGECIDAPLIGDNSVCFFNKQSHDKILSTSDGAQANFPAYAIEESQGKFPHHHLQDTDKVFTPNDSQLFKEDSLRHIGPTNTNRTHDSGKSNPHKTIPSDIPLMIFQGIIHAIK